MTSDPRGLTIINAIIQFAPQEFADAMQLVKRRHAAGTLDAKDSFVRMLWFELAALMIKGDLRATAIADSDRTPMAIDPADWIAAMESGEVNVDLNTMTAGPVSYRAVRVARLEGAANLETYLTGLAGRPPKSRDLLLAELRRRMDLGVEEARVASEARALLKWLATTHPTATAPQQQSVENLIRPIMRARKTP